MNKQALLDLAARCEQATGADCEIDRDIKTQLGTSWDYAADWGRREQCQPVAFAYTASLDAAMTLVPEQPAILAQGHRWFRMIDERPMLPYPLPPNMRWGYKQDTFFEAWLRRTPDRFIARAATHALALTAACLRALAQEIEHD